MCLTGSVVPALDRHLVVDATFDLVVSLPLSDL